MGVEGRATTTAATDPAVRAIDAAQYETGIGPCLDAYRHRAVYRISDTEKDETWRPFSEAAAARGIRSTLSLPLVANGEGVGALNFYSRCPGAFGQGGDDEERIASAFAAQAAVVLANAEAYWDARVLTEQLGFALETRATIEQAKGILMASGRTADDAFQLLVRASQRENRNLNAVAADIVAEAERRGSIQ